MNIKGYELDELILRIYGFSEEEIEKKLNDLFDADEFLTEKLGNTDSVIDFAHDLVNRLMPFCFAAKSPLTGQPFQGFGYVRDNCMIAIAQREIKHDE